MADGSRYELSWGELVLMAPVGFQDSAIAMRLDKLLSRYVDEKGPGVVGTEGGFKLLLQPETTRT